MPLPSVITLLDDTDGLRDALSRMPSLQPAIQLLDDMLADAADHGHHGELLIDADELLTMAAVRGVSQLKLGMLLQSMPPRNYRQGRQPARGAEAPAGGQIVERSSELAARSSTVHAFRLLVEACV